MTAAMGLLLGLAIGAACRWWDLPLPAPPKLTGALLVVCMTLGFLMADAWSRDAALAYGSALQVESAPYATRGHGAQRSCLALLMAPPNGD